MNTLSCSVRYRPLRIGWCIRDNNFDDLRNVLRLTHTLWGGKYNPVIPISDQSFAKQLIRVFRIDALYPASEDKEITDFIKQFPYLPWPFSRKELFTKSSYGFRSTILDVNHPIRNIFEIYFKNVESPSMYSVLFEWTETDQLSDIFLATFGAFPSKEEIGFDYRSLLGCLNISIIPLDVDKSLPPLSYAYFTPSAITTYDLYPDIPSGWNNRGFYIGDTTDFYDIVNFWNLRASGNDLLFYDSKHSERLDSLKNAFLEALRKDLRNYKEGDNHIAIWRKDRETDIDTSAFGSDICRYAATKTIWNGLNVKPSVMYFQRQTVLGSVSEEYELPTITFGLPSKPVYDDIKFHSQHLVVSTSFSIDIRKPEGATFKTPYIPQLNEYYGRECYFVWNAARVEVDGLGIIINLTQNHITLRALESRNLIGKIFEVFGMKAESSPPGLVGFRLIQQMGGLQGCRVFKIDGVRKLIAKYSPYKWFNKSAAIRIIGQNDPVTGKPNFSQYENLYIEKRRGGELKPNDTFIYLLKKEVFRVGLRLNCPNCQLDFWISLDDVRTKAKCEYCGDEFNITPQLKDRDWAYRRSGLFGREDHQEGAIPVVLTLQQLDTILSQDMIYATSMNIIPISATIDPCETDLVILTQGQDGRVQLAIGECKSNDEITEKDVTNMKKVADTFPNEQIDVFIIFTKLSPFTPVEIERCRTAQGHYKNRVIMLSARELEPYFIYELTAEEFEIDEIAVSLEDLAKNTYSIYFEPRRKAKKN